MLILDAPAQYLHQRQQKRNEHERFDALGLAKLDKIRAGYLIEAKKRRYPCYCCYRIANCCAW